MTHREAVMKCSAIRGPSIESTIFTPMNAVAFIFFESVVGGGVYWRAASTGGQHLLDGGV